MALAMVAGPRAGLTTLDATQAQAQLPDCFVLRRRWPSAGLLTRGWCPVTEDAASQEIGRANRIPRPNGCPDDRRLSARTQATWEHRKTVLNRCTFIL